MTNMLMEDEKFFCSTQNNNRTSAVLFVTKWLLSLSVVNHIKYKGVSSLHCTQCVHTCVCVCVHPHTQGWTQVHTYKYMHMNVHALTRVRTHAGRNACARAHAHTHTHTHTKAVCLSNVRLLKYTCTTPQPPATSNLLILRPTTNFITIFCHLVVLSCIICSVLNCFFSLSPHTPQKKQTAGPP